MGISRRKFLERAATIIIGAQILPSRVLGRGGTAPSNKINMAIIGNGLISEGHRNYFAWCRQTQVMALCDVHQGRLASAKESVEAVNKKRDDVGSHPIFTTEDYQEILDRNDIDAVTICTPDHWHVQIALKAIQAGKAVYVEKPMSLTVEEGRILANAVKKANGILQVGSQQRSEWAFRKASELVRNGYIGNVHTIKTNIGEFPPEPKDLKEEPIPSGFNYDKWLGQTPWRPYNPERVLGNYGGGWRRFYEYGIRKEGDWGAHHFDIIQWALGMDDSGPTDFYPEGSNNSEFRHYKYANGPVIYINTPMKNNHMIHFIGDEGEILVSRNGRIETSPKFLRDLPMRAQDARLQISNDHRKDFLESILYGKKNICPAEIGHRSATVCHLMSFARRLKTHIRWDPKAEKIIDNPVAASMMSRPRRAPYYLGV